MDGPGRVNEFRHYSFLPFFRPFAGVSPFCDVLFSTGIFTFYGLLQLQNKIGNFVLDCWSSRFLFAGLFRLCRWTFEDIFG